MCVYEMITYVALQLLLTSVKQIWICGGGMSRQPPSEQQLHQIICGFSKIFIGFHQEVNLKKKKKKTPSVSLLLTIFLLILFVKFYLVETA